MNRALLLLLLVASTWVLGGCITLAWMGTKKASEYAAASGQPGVSNVGQATYSGMERVPGEERGDT